jgi:hypothetical protein
MILIDKNIITVSTKTLDAVINNGALVSLCDKKGVRFVEADAEKNEVLRILYRHSETVPVKNTRSGAVYTHSLSDTCAEIRFDAWDGNGLITITEDTETGDLCIEPEVTSARQGILACRYTVEGICGGYRLVAPFYQGIDMELDDILLSGRKWQWPFMWEAGLCILHNGENGFWVHCEDDRYRAKSVITGGERRGLSFDSETYGPVDRSMSAGGIMWRINVFDGTWQVPAERYRAWLWKAYSLEHEEARRFDWTKDIKLAVSWCPSDAALLDSIAKKVDPKTVLLHLPQWREHNYDTCYPDYTPSDNFVAFMRYAHGLGFHCMPHANSVDMDPSMTEYKYLSDFKYREIEGGRLLGWGWENGHALGVPSSNKALTESREKLVMVKIHPGLSMWRSLLAENINKALKKLEYMTDTIFIDVTLCSYNLDNCLVDNTTSMEGMKRIITHIEGIHSGLAVGGEGLNEITFQNLSFAQAHLFDSHQGTTGGLDRCGGCDLNNILFGRLCRTMGYSNLAGENESQILRERIHEEHGAIPTITVSNYKQITNPNAEIKRVLELARG